MAQIPQNIKSLNHVQKNQPLNQSTATSFLFALTHPRSVRSIIILYSILHPYITGSLLLSGLLNRLCAFFTHPICHTPVLPKSHSTHWSPYYYLVKRLNISLLNFLQPPITSSHWVPNILFNTLLSNTFNLFSSHTRIDQVSHPCKKLKSFVYINLNIFKQKILVYITHTV